MGAAPLLSSAPWGCDTTCCYTRDNQGRAESVQVLTVEAPTSPRGQGPSQEFPNLCMPMSSFMKLEKLLPQEEAIHKLVEPQDDATCHFISHEWLGFVHPDPDSTQLKRMQQIFAKFICGEAQQLFRGADWEAFLHGVSAGTGHSRRGLEEGVVERERRTAEDVAYHVSAGFVWCDFHSIPQAVKDDTFFKAVNSIPYYVERCDYFWICAPNAIHGDLREPRDFASWRRRGWCRLEETANLLSRNLKMPMVVTDKPFLSTYGFFDASIHIYNGRPERSVFNGNFTCCHFHHKMSRPNGTIEHIGCDKDTIAPMISRMFRNVISKPAKEQRFRTNVLRNMALTIFAGYPSELKQWLPNPNESLDDVLAKLGFESLESKDTLGWSPLPWIVWSGNLELACKVAEARPALLENAGSDVILMLSVALEPKKYRRLVAMHSPEMLAALINRPSPALGVTAVDRAAKLGHSQNLELLLELRAEVDTRRRDNDATPLISAASEHYGDCVETLLAHRADVNACDMHGKTALHWAVDPVSILGNPEPGAGVAVIRALLEGRANVTLRDKQGKSAFELARELQLGGRGLQLLLDREVAWDLHI